MAHIVTVFPGMGRNKNCIGVFRYHLVHLVIVHSVEIDNHFVLGSQVQNFVKAFAGLILPPKHIGNQLSNEANACFMHFVVFVNLH